MMLLVAMANVMWDYREGEVVVMEDILMAKLPELHVEDEQRIHSREPRKIQAAFDSDW